MDQKEKLYKSAKDAEEFNFVHEVGSVDNYRHRLCLVYTDPKKTHVHFHRWDVAEVRTYKNKGCSVRHEYLVARLLDKNGLDILLRIDRRIHGSSNNTFFRSLLGSSTPATPSPPTAPTHPSLPTNTEAGQPKFRKIAADEVSIIPASRIKKKKSVAFVQLTKGQLCLPELIVLACEVHQYSRTYHFAEENCYWFCSMVLEAITEKLRKDAGSPHDPQHNELLPTDPPLALQDAIQESVRDPFVTSSLPPHVEPSWLDRPGTWNGIPATKPLRAVNIHELVADYDKSWKEFQDDVTDRIPKSKERANEERKEYERRVEDESNRADEERKRAEEERKRAEEERERAERAEEEKQEERKRAERAEEERQEERKRAERAEEERQEERKRADEERQEERKRADEERKDAERRIAELEAKLAAFTK
ncbi:hypothetical protein APHAL10511_003055 [Amanita phalloides]|nr:hypothetical protein APHAL10511_003055 [Amanita phalloides]